jgi:hypothetical protein
MRRQFTPSRLSCTDHAQRSRHGAMGVQGTKKRAAKLKAKGSSSTSMNRYGWSPTVQQRISVTSVASTGLDGWRPKTVVPFNSFSEFNKGEHGDVWLALDEMRRLARIAGI